MTPKKFFSNQAKLHSASAPGRLDVMGGIADYSGSLVLQMPLAEDGKVSVALRDDGLVRAYSKNAESIGSQALVEKDWKTLKRSKDIRAEFSTQEDWAAYVFGCALLLLKRGKQPFNGADFYIESKVPAGKGVSASAALEVASMLALAKALKKPFIGTELPKLCQKVENDIVGAPCGLMDQLASYLGVKDHLLPILCQPDQVQAPIPIPKGLHFVGIDSGVRHAVSGSSYTDVRTATFMGYSLLTDELFKHRNLQGYPARISPSLFDEHCLEYLPERMNGGAFLWKKLDWHDPATSVKIKKNYAVRTCIRHPIEENMRVHLFKELLSKFSTKKAERETHYHLLGELMYQSHLSYSDCGLGSEATDAIVDYAREQGPSKKVFGAKITGGGSGGTVCLLVEGKEGLASAERIAKRIAREFEGAGQFFKKSSTGAKFRK